MANPNFFAQARGDAARKGFEAQTEEELPENLEELSFDETQQLPEATVLSPAMTPQPAYFMDPEGEVDRRPQALVQPPMADIAQSPRAAAGGQGESPAQIEATVADAETQAAAMEAAVQEVIGTTDIDRIKQLLAQHDAGIFAFPPDNLQVLREYVAMHDKGTEYMRANVEGQRAR